MRHGLRLLVMTLLLGPLGGRRGASNQALDELARRQAAERERILQHGRDRGLLPRAVIDLTESTADGEVSIVAELSLDGEAQANTEV